MIMTSFRRVAPVLGVLLGLCIAGQAMADEIRLQIDGIQGDTAGKAGPFIQVQSVSFGLSNSGAVATGGGGAGRASFTAMELRRNVGTASPKLMTAAASGQHFKQATLDFVKAGEQAETYLQIVLEDVIVSGYQVGSDGGGQPMETVSLNFAKITMTYWEQRPDGSKGAPVTGGWDIMGNKAVSAPAESSPAPAEAAAPTAEPAPAPTAQAPPEAEAAPAASQAPQPAQVERAPSRVLIPPGGLQRQRR